jgi:hypothetical protein
MTKNSIALYSLLLTHHILTLADVRSLSFPLTNIDEGRNMIFIPRRWSVEETVNRRPTVACEAGVFACDKGTRLLVFWRLLRLRRMHKGLALRSYKSSVACRDGC